MGQNASTNRDHEEPLDRRHRLLPRRFRSRNVTQEPQSTQEGLEALDEPVEIPDASSSHPHDSHSWRSLATFSRQILAHSTPLVRGRQANSRNASAGGEIFYEQQEERPLVHMGDLGMRDAPITHIAAASPMPRRSTLSRIGSMVVPRSEANASDDSHREGRFRGLSETGRSSSVGEQGERQSRRYSLFSTLSVRHPRNSSVGRRTEHAPISRPYPLTPTAIPSTPALMASSIGRTLPNPDLPTDPDTRASGFFSNPLRNRLSGFRRSITGLSDIPTDMDITSQLANAQTPPPPRPSRLALADDPDFLLPALSTADASMNLGNALPDARHNHGGDLRRTGISPVSESPERPPLHTDGPNWVERWSERGSAGRRESRRMPNVLRGRSSRLIRRDNNDGSLPRILSLAASAIAAQLAGSAERPISDIHAIGPNDLDGSLTSLFRILQHASDLVADGGDRDRGNNNHQPPGPLGPPSFLRVFRFVTQSNNGRAPSGSSAADRPGQGTAADVQPGSTASNESEGRTVTLVVVGVRSLVTETARQEERRPVGEPGMDSLLDLPPVAPPANLIRSATGGMGRNTSGRSRFTHRRRASVGGVNTFPANYDSQRHHRTSSSSRSTSGVATPSSGISTPLVLSESPAGPHPPPSSPADAGLSAQSSQATTPSRRPSSASAAQRAPMTDRDLASRRLREAGIPTPGERDDHSTRLSQQRRRSDSEFARHRELGAGAARRNGVVEPDDLETGETSATANRSWLIYVVGTNLSEDHPALTTPSLFTDLDEDADSSFLQNPTYEDMLLLSSLLGPAKPPVASRDDVATAQGLYRIQETAGTLIAMAVTGNGRIVIAPNEQCLVCLEDYREDDELRQLNKCAHLFHRECIDEWLTTGRNSCPLCRGQGVEETKQSTASESRPSAAAGPSAVS